MAGIGFELKKLFRDQGLLGSMRAYAFSSLTTAGPMMLCMSMIVAMQWLMTRHKVDFLERELFLATVVYSFIFSVLLTGGLSMILTRFISDMIFVKKYEHLLSSFYGALSVCLPLGALVAWLFLRDIPEGFGYKAAAFIFFSELIVIWLQTVHLSALKDYKRIVRNFLYGVVIAVLGSWLVLKYTSYGDATVVLAIMDVGFFVIVVLFAKHFEEKFPRKESRVYLSFLEYFRKYPSLFFIGTFFYAGVYIHSFVYWFGTDSHRVAEKYAVSPFYDLPVFYAYLTVIPSLVTFVVSVETSFYEKFRDYYSNILNGGTLMDITRAKTEMQRVLMQEISFIMEVQLLFTIVSIALGFKFLPALGFSAEQLRTYAILVLANFLFIMAFIVMLLMLYYDDRKGVLSISGLFVVLNAGLTYWSKKAGLDGLGMFVASFVILVLSLSRLLMYVRNIDYYTFCAQPLTVRKKTRFWQRRKGKASAVALSLLATIMLLSACTDEQVQQADPAKQSAIAATGQTSGLTEDKRLYERDDDTSVKALYLTVLPDKPDKGKPLTWYELNRIKSVLEEGDMKAIVQEGAPDGSGPAQGMFGYGTTEANAKVSLRGASTRYSAQRSYKVKLNDQAGFWLDQRVFNLNKHWYDASRVRNKLSFDMLETLPNMASLRTQFIHLYVKDLSEAGAANKPYEDYGLFTHVENPNETFLKNHWLDPYGQLYKANLSEFYRYPEELKLSSDPSYDKKAFETRFDIQGSEDHAKLLAMLDDVNNPAIPINEVMEKHFDMENYLTWLAANILMDNMDTDAHNYLLYSPLNSNKWYFLPWDYDGGWEKRLYGYRSGISNYWSNVLHNRFFRSVENVRLLEDKVDELYQTINNDAVTKRLETYRKVVEPFISRAPDINFLPIKANEYEAELKHLSGVPLRALKRFKEDVEKPKPFYLGDLHKKNDGSYEFVWDPSFDLQGEDLFYEWTLAKDPAFTQIVDQKKDLAGTHLSLSGLTPGTYYWKVLAVDKSGHKQIAFDVYKDIEGEPYYGIREIKVE